MLQIYANEIEKSKHIVLKTNNKGLANASAIYSYLLTLHKKVTLYLVEKPDPKFEFLPWFEKITQSALKSYDLEIEVGAQSLDYYDFFDSNEIKINQKMATALYAGLFESSEHFTCVQSAGMLFASLSKLIERGADFKSVEHYLYRSNPLSLFRIKSILYKSMLLENNATEAELFICDADFKASGASMSEVYRTMQEVLTLAHVHKVVLKKSDESMKVIKEIEIVK